MRVGTWNLEGRWDDRHAALLSAQECDVWLLTEVSERARLQGWCATTTATPMAPGRAWAAVWSKEGHTSLAEPHPASTAAGLGDLVLCSSVLPWRSCGSDAPWSEGSTADKTSSVLAALDGGLAAGPLVWGGDWNHSLAGQEYVGSAAGRAAVLALLEARGLVASTADLPSCVPGVLSIDHIAAPAGWSAAARHVVAEQDGVRLSDHDAYVVDLQR